MYCRFQLIAFLLVGTLACGLAGAQQPDPVYAELPSDSGGAAGELLSDDALDQTALPLPPTEFVAHAYESYSAGEVDVGESAAGDFGASNGGDCGCAGGYTGGCGGDCTGGCGGCVVYGVNGCPLPRWRARAGGVYMRRESTNNTDLVLENVAFAGGALTAGDTLIDASDFDLNWEIGFDVSLMRGIDMGYGTEMEARVLYLTTQNDTLQRTGDDVEIFSRTLAAGDEPPATLAPRTNPVDVAARYSSDFRTLELNYRRPVQPWMTVMAGFRYADLSETLNLATIDSAGPALSSASRYATENDMYGLQLGGETTIFGDQSGLEIRGIGKIGLYYNDMGVNVESSGDGFVDGQGEDDSGQVAWLGEFALLARYNINCNASASFGYQVISVDGVAVATEQTTSVVDPLDGPDLDVTVNAGTVFYHGATASIEFRR